MQEILERTFFENNNLNRRFKRIFAGHKIMYQNENRSKIIKINAIGLFAMALLLNVSLSVDSVNSQNTDLSLGSLKVSLFQKAYAEGSVEIPGYCVHWTVWYCAPDMPPGAWITWC